VDILAVGENDPGTAATVTVAVAVIELLRVRV
jgi:hypothetical protein